MRLCECSLAGVCACAVIYRLSHGVENKSGSRCSCVREEEHHWRRIRLIVIRLFFLYFHYLNCYFSVLFTEKQAVLSKRSEIYIFVLKQLRK